VGMWIGVTTIIECNGHATSCGHALVEVVKVLGNFVLLERLALAEVDRLRKRHGKRPPISRRCKSGSSHCDPRSDQSAHPFFPRFPACRDQVSIGEQQKKKKPSLSASQHRCPNSDGLTKLGVPAKPTAARAGERLKRAKEGEKRLLSTTRCHSRTFPLGAAPEGHSPRRCLELA